MRKRITLALAMGLLALSGSAGAENTVGIFTLDGLSFISFGDQQYLFPETGSTLRFEFLNPNEDGTIPFRLEPEGNCRRRKLRSESGSSVAWPRSSIRRLPAVLVVEPPRLDALLPE
jgi:hypothetical protein